jgi:tRNA/tmRNA/rRNA uracil-C5-methylase (TrmA/RlmC/RlmD family)
LISCPHRPPCSGCPRYAEPDIAPAARLALDELAARHHISPVSIESGRLDGFRLRARLAIRGRLGSPKIGLFELGTHRVVHIPNCRVHHPLINEVANIVRRALVEARLTCYSDGAHMGLARYLQVAVERRTQTAQIVLVGNYESPEPFAECFSLIRERLGAKLHSLWFNSNRESTNTIFTSHFHKICGPDAINENFGGADIFYPPGAFGQSNLEIAGRIIEHLRALVPPAAIVTEYYGGVGAIGLSLLDRVQELRINEVSPQSLLGLEQGLAQLGPARAKVQVFAGSAEGALTAGEDADVIIVDPPRKGLELPLIESIVHGHCKHLLYVSCGIDSLARDAAVLTRAHLTLTTLRAFNLFPFTEHVETLACFERTCD